MKTSASRLLAAALVFQGASAWSQNTPEPAPYKLDVQVQQSNNTFETRASFQLPLSPCQAWSYLTNYDAATHIPGVVSSKTLRQSDGHIRVERELRETILLFPIRMHTVLEFTEIPLQGTQFIQLEGEAKSHHGSWHLEAVGDETVFRYHAISVPDTALPLSIIRYFLDKRLKGSFAAMAEHGARQKTHIHCNRSAA